ncbi:hypothetical protein MVEN_00951900 [Mycena venus]|uniref:Uncharacterized protein n=1 Tax=Mycena venus TaxID=2733690 RepID=A0A8H6Y8C9_9AGAR|nr:hypothetical protein MVEN_00951900 [Mycena venus]
MLAFLSLFSDVLALLFILLTHVSLSSGSVLTAIIDDTAGDSRPGGTPPVYSGSFSLNSNCDGCTVHPDPASAYDGTWHDSSQFGGAPPVSVTLSFNGIGIDVFCIMANVVPGASTATSLAFTLDGTPQQKPFTHDPDPANPEYEYGVNVFSISGLSQSDHELVVATNNPSGSLLLFDYAQYRRVVFSVSILADPTTPNPVTNTVIKISTTEITATATDTQKITTAATTLPNTSISSSSFSSTSPASFPKNPSSSIAISSALLGNNSMSAPPTIPPGNSSDSSPSSLAPPVIASSSKRFNYAAVLAGTLIPIFLIAVVGVLCWRRRRRRANIPDTESVSNNGLIAPFFGSTYGDPHPRHQPRSHQSADADNAESESASDSESWVPSVSPFDRNANSVAMSARGMQVREKYNSGATGGNFTLPSPIEYTSDPPFSPPPASEYTFETGPPPIYSEQRPLPLPGVPPRTFAPPGMTQCHIWS